MNNPPTAFPSIAAPSNPANAAYQDAVLAFSEALRVGTVFEVLLAFRATVATAIAMFRTRPAPAGQATTDALEHELAGVDRDIADRAGRLVN
jgi:hypothetical protein